MSNKEPNPSNRITPKKTLAALALSATTLAGCYTQPTAETRPTLSPAEQAEASAQRKATVKELSGLLPNSDKILRKKDGSERNLTGAVKQLHRLLTGYVERANELGIPTSASDSFYAGMNVWWDSNTLDIAEDGAVVFSSNHDRMPHDSNNTSVYIYDDRIYVFAEKYDSKNGYSKEIATTGPSRGTILTLEQVGELTTDIASAVGNILEEGRPFSLSPTIHHDLFPIEEEPTQLGSPGIGGGRGTTS